MTGSLTKLSLWRYNKSVVIPCADILEQNSVGEAFRDHKTTLDYNKSVVEA